MSTNNIMILVSGSLLIGILIGLVMAIFKSENKNIITDAEREQINNVHLKAYIAMERYGRAGTKVSIDKKKVVTIKLLTENEINEILLLKDSRLKIPEGITIYQKDGTKITS